MVPGQEQALRISGLFLRDSCLQQESLDTDVKLACGQSDSYYSVFKVRNQLTDLDYWMVYTFFCC